MSQSSSTIALLSDIHANYEALQAVLNDCPDVDEIVCAGDIVGYGPSPQICLGEIRNREIPTVEGNHDRSVVGGWYYEEGDKYAGGVLTHDQLEWLDNLPRTRKLFNNRLKVVHDHPEEQDKYMYPAEFDASLLNDESVLVLGHTHIQHSETYDDGIVVNPGSVGQPRDGNPDAAYALVDLANMRIDLRRVSYDIQRVQSKIVNRGLAQRAANRLEKGQ